MIYKTKIYQKELRLKNIIWVLCGVILFLGIFIIMTRKELKQVNADYARLCTQYDTLCPAYEEKDIMVKVVVNLINKNNQ